MSTPLMVRPELLSVDLTGKTYVVTGANSGIGLVTAQQLAKQGATVVMGVRRVSEGERAAAEFVGKSRRPSWSSITSSWPTLRRCARSRRR